MDSSRSQDPRLYRGQPSSASPHASQPPAEQPPRRTSPSVYPYEQRPTSSTYPYEQQAPRPPAQQQPPQQPPQQQPPRQQPPQQQFVPRAQRRNPAPRRLLGVLAFLVLTGLSLPLHIAAIFFIYVEFESPGDPAMAALLISGAFLGSFAALLITGIGAQLIGGFPGRWRARITFATLSGIIALAVAYLAALKLF